MNVRHTLSPKTPIHLKNLEFEMSTIKKTRMTVKKGLFERSMPVLLLKPNKFPIEWSFEQKSSEFYGYYCLV